jgi:hypothetical protein
LHEHIEYVAWETESEKEFAWHIHSLLTFCQVPKKPVALQIEHEAENVNALRMKYMARAQQVCVYPPMIHRAIVHFEKLLYELEETAPQVSTAQQVYPNMDTAQLYVSQSKIDAVMKTLLERSANGSGKIVFCRYYAEIDILAQRLQLADPTLQVAKFDGRVKNSKRAEVLGTPVDILLAQIKMCREGLNLQDNYSEVYFPSPDFNPATEQQAIARCWRMGQKKEVHVFRYILGTTACEAASAYETAVEAPSEAASEVEASASETASAAASACETASAPAPGNPLTMDMFASQLHVKKHEFVSRMAGSAATCKALEPTIVKKIKINYKKNKV